MQADLGRTIQYMADQEKAAAGKGREAGLAAARDAFYRGDIAQTIAKYHRENGGLLTEADLAEYRSEIETPLQLHLQGHRGDELRSLVPGPVLLQMLSMLDEVDLEALGHNSKEYVHLLAEVMNLCFADRERYYGDPRFVDVPMETLLSRALCAGAAEDDPQRPRLRRDAAGRCCRRPRRGSHPQAVGRRRRAGTAGRHLLRLRGRFARATPFGDAERRVVGKPGHSRAGPLPVVARLAVLGRSRPHLRRRAGQAAAGSRPIRRWPCARASS